MKHSSFITLKDPSTVFSDSQFLNKHFPRIVIDGGIETFSRDEQFIKQQSPSETNDGGRFISFNDSPINEMLVGISIFIKCLHPLKAQFPIFITEDGINTCFNEEQPSKA